MGENIPKRFVCPNCGGAALAVQADAWWDYETQSWQFAVCDGEDDYCGDCSDYVHGEFVPVTDLRSAALVAINRSEAT